MKKLTTEEVARRKEAADNLKREGRLARMAVKDAAHRIEMDAVRVRRRQIAEDVVDAISEAIGVDSGAFTDLRMDAAVKALNDALLKHGKRF